ncbi:Laccase-15 [Acorus calamus]|uniref:Laccase n=1 Tax=Acorus calamus TaxID=4465 RepID=A0AAV9CPV3_ACOCL|nr:Laccase-15 [Acorus calamus]
MGSMEALVSRFVGLILVLHALFFSSTVQGGVHYQNFIGHGRHGVKQPRNPWSDGPAYITQCPIRPGSSFRYKIVFSTEEGTVWWHAHNDWTRATVHGAIIVQPPLGRPYPFPTPNAETSIILGEWWRSDVKAVLEEALRTGGDPNVSDTFTINGQPGDLYPCSRKNTFRLRVRPGETRLLRVVSAAMNDELFFAVAGHSLTVVGADGGYVKPFTTDYIMITPGQTYDVLLVADRPPSLYYMAAHAFSDGLNIPFDNTTATAILQYVGAHITSPTRPRLPFYNNTGEAARFTGRLRSLANPDHPIRVPAKIDQRLLITVSVNTLPCARNQCQGPNGTRLFASLNNISFQEPHRIDVLEAYHAGLNGVFGAGFPSKPPLFFNFTASNLPASLQRPMLGTEVRVVKYNENVEIVLQGTNLLAGENHPMHLHGYSFYVVGAGFGNFDVERDPLMFNLIDPPLQNTVGVPKNGWTAIRFTANNPG